MSHSRVTHIASGVLCTTVLAVLAPAGSAEAKKGPTITPDPKVQAMIRALVYADDDDEAFVAAKPLKKMAANAPQLLAPNLLSYGIVEVTNDIEVVGTARLVRELYKVPGLRGPIVPFLESESERIRAEAAHWLQAIDSDFGVYFKTLRSQKDAPPPGLVTYLYESDPSAAMLLFARVYAEDPGNPPRDLLWADHLLNTVQWRVLNGLLQEGDREKAREEVTKLSKHDAWYARRYVVEVLRSSINFGTPEIANRLKNDPNPLVRERADLPRFRGDASKVPPIPKQ